MKPILKLPTFALAAAACGISISNADPGWWTMGDDPAIRNSSSANRAVANIGQAKWMAKSALEALRKVIPTLADDIEADLVGAGKPIASWAAPSTPEESARQFSPLLIGQLKAIAEPFYDNIESFAPAWLNAEMIRNETRKTGTHLPWTFSTGDDDNRAVANLGQLKAVFALDFGGDRELGANRDSIPDLWEHGVVHADGGVTWTSIGQINNTNALVAGSGSPVGNPFVTVGMQASTEIANRIVGLSASSALAIYSIQDHEPTASDPNGVYIRNPDFWAADLVQQITCISPANSTGAWHHRGGTAITPRHIIMTNHDGFYIGDGDDVRFVTSGNQVISKTVLKSRQVGVTDFRVAVLDSDLPVSITPCKVPPASFRDYFAKRIFLPGQILGEGMSPGILGLMLDQEEKGLVGDLRSLSQSGCGFNQPVDTQALAFNESAVSGDSGNPCFLVIEDQLVLMTAFTTAILGPGGKGGGTGGATWGANASLINSTIGQLDLDVGISTGYTLTEVNLGSFPIFEVGGL